MPEKRWGTCIMALMRLSARADYALRAAIELAAASSGHVTADQLARAQQIPGKFLETILTQLRRAGLLRRQRGPDGGFWPARRAAELPQAVRDRGADRHEATLAAQAHARLRGNPQAGLPGDAEDRLALQLGQGEVV